MQLIKVTHQQCRLEFFKKQLDKELARLAEHMPCITLAQALAMLEGL